MLNERGERILNAGGRPWSNGSQERAMTDEPEDFAAMFEASLKTSRAKRLVTGETVEGTIVALGPEVAFVDVGGKAEATIEVGELKDAEGDIEVAVGDRIRAMVVSTAGGLRLSRKLVRGAAVDRQLEDAFRAGLPVEGRVENEIKGGYDVRIGHQRAFCPFSQIDVHRSEPATHLGKVYTFRILEYGNGGRNLVVSRRALLEEEQQAKAAEVRRSVVAGAVLTGRVASVPAFGAFVDLGGGVQGLLHVSEMGWSRVADPSALFKPGDEITVKVLRVDDEAARSRPVVARCADLRGRTGPSGPRRACRRVRRLRRARARDRGAGACVDVRVRGRSCRVVSHGRRRRRRPRGGGDGNRS
jgi:small subunit ribosomal protein S1